MDCPGSEHRDRRHQRHVDGRHRRLASSRPTASAACEPGPAATYPYPTPRRAAQLLRADRRPDAGPGDPLAELEATVTRRPCRRHRGVPRATSPSPRQASRRRPARADRLHRPERRLHAPARRRRAHRRALGIDVVNRFRHADVAAGGEGAPFAPLYHRALAAALPQPLMVLNLGGVGNVTYLDGDDGDRVRHRPRLRAARRFRAEAAGHRLRRGRRLAASGSAGPGARRRLMQHPYFAAAGAEVARPQRLPRLGRGASKRSTTRTARRRLAAFTVELVADALQHVPQRAEALAGDGRRAPQRHLHAHAGRAAWACRSIRSRPSAGTATSSRRSASAISPCARCAACR